MSVYRIEYHPPSQYDDYYSCNLSKALDTINSNYEKFLLIGDFNSEDHEIEISNFLNNHEAKNIVKEKTYFKSILNQSLVCLSFITNSPKNVQYTHRFLCGLSDRHSLFVTVLKNTFRKQKCNIRYYKDWGKFDNTVFQTELREALIRVETHGYKCFEQIFLSLFLADKYWSPGCPEDVSLQRLWDVP